MNPLIVVVGYNRPKSMLRLLKSVDNADYDSDDVTLLISLDKADNDNGVLKIATSFNWHHGNKIIRTFEKRQGLRNHIIQCGDLTDEYGAVIVLEDDLIVSSGYYRYVCKALEYYTDDCIAGISLYSHEWNGYARRFYEPVADEYDTYLGQFSITWGQCWTREAWKNFKNWYNNNQELKYNYFIPKDINNWGEKSWGKYFVYYITEKKLFYVIPRVSFSTNCSEIGEHSYESNNDHQVRLFNGKFNDFRFAPVKKACRYDIFFENMKLDNYLPQKIKKYGVDIDLNNTGKNSKEKRFVLSTANLPYKIVKSYGLQLRPIDMNIILGVAGKGIYLYDKSIPRKKNKDEFNCYDMIRYEVRGMVVRKLACYYIFQIKERYKGVLVEFVKKIVSFHSR